MGQWTDGGSDPQANIQLGREVIRATIGRYPNTLLLGPAAYNAARMHPKVIERFKYTTDAPVTADMLATLLEVNRVVVGTSIYMDEDDTPHDVWGADAILTYVPGQGASLRTPAYGYTYVLTGNPFVEPANFDTNVKSWLYPVTYERKPVIVGPGAGYLIRNAAS